MAVFVLSLGLSYYFGEYRFRFRLLFVTNLHVAYFSRFVNKRFIPWSYTATPGPRCFGITVKLPGI